MRLVVCSAPSSIIREIGEDTYKLHYGLLTTPRSGHTPRAAVDLGVPWMMDNDAFSGFDARVFKTMLKRYQAIPGCQWVAVPDVVGDAWATLKRFYQWRQIVIAFGYPVALVAQNGLEHLTIPWNQFNCLFIGGDTAWKLGPVAAGIAYEAKKRGKWVHMGRVNSARRIRYAQSIGCDSVDGSGYARFKRRNHEALPYLQTHQLNFMESI